MTGENDVWADLEPRGATSIFPPPVRGGDLQGWSATASSDLVELARGSLFLSPRVTLPTSARPVRPVIDHHGAFAVAFHRGFPGSPIG